MLEKQSLPSAPILIEAIRSLGYSFQTAIADLIDNSISAMAKRIDIILIPNEYPQLIIFDNGFGMCKEELEEALRYGAKNPLEKRSEIDLGRFGLGMKSASLSQCRKLIVISKKDGKLSGFSWDLDYVIERQGWYLLEYGEDEIRKLPNISLFDNVDTGTYLLLENFDRVSSSTANLNNTLRDYMSNTINHLALVFHRYLDDGVEIYVNNNKIKSRDPFLLSNKSTMALREQNITIDNENIKVKPYILPYISKLTQEDLEKVGGKEDLKNNQGFYIYRNKRLIIWGTWFRLTRKEELGKLARVMVDIPNSLDYMWGIDIKKSTANLPDIIKKKLYACIDESIFQSKTVHNYRGRKVNKDKDINYIWERIELRDGCYEYKINRNIQQLKILEETLNPNQLKALDIALNIIEEQFPTNSLYLDASQGKVIEPENDENNEVIEKLYNEIKESLELCASIGMNKETALDALLKTEPYCNYEKLRSMFKEEEL